jgi:hypothetical protein
MTNQLTEVTNETLEQVNGGFLAVVGRGLIGAGRALNTTAIAGTRVATEVAVPTIATGVAMGGVATAVHLNNQEREKKIAAQSAEMDRILAEMGQ